MVAGFKSEPWPASNRNPGRLPSEFAFCVLMMGYGLWSLHVASCYQALCEISYWSASRAELKLCDERRGEFGL